MSNSINVSFMKRVTTGPYEHEEMKVEFSVPNQDLLDSITSERREFVYRTLGKPVPATQFTTPAISQETNSLKGETHGNSQESNKETSEKTSSKKASKKSSSKVQEEVITAPEATEEMEEVESPFATKEAPAEKKTKEKKSDAIVYDRENPDHRSTMSNYLVRLTGGKEWSKDKEKSKKASAELTGKPFLDKVGEILPSFQELCKEKFGIATNAL